MASPSVLKDSTTIHRIGKKITMATIQAMMVVIVLRRVVVARAMIRPPYASRFLPTTRSRNTATMLARMMA